jgi:hypothetical protein
LPTRTGRLSRQLRQLPLGQVPFAADPEHDLQVRAPLQLGGGGIGQEGEELVRLVRDSRELHAARMDAAQLPTTARPS